MWGTTGVLRDEKVTQGTGSRNCRFGSRVEVGSTAYFPPFLHLEFPRSRKDPDWESVGEEAARRRCAARPWSFAAHSRRSTVQTLSRFVVQEMWACGLYCVLRGPTYVLKRPWRLCACGGA